MEELRGDQGVWRFDDEKVAIVYNARRSVGMLARTLGRCDVPMAAVRSVDFRPGGRKGWELRLRLAEGADPYAAVGAMASDHQDPFRLTGSAESELLAEYCADRLAFAVQTASVPTEEPPMRALAQSVVPPLPFHIKAGDGTAFFDGRTVRLNWFGQYASGLKRKTHRREFPVEEIRKVEWTPGDVNTVGFLRILPWEAEEAPVTKPEKDLRCLTSVGRSRGAQHVRTLIMAATITAYLGSDPPVQPPPIGAPHPDADTSAVYDRIRELGRLHDEGLLTDEEFGAKKAELLGRL